MYKYSLGAGCAKSEHLRRCADRDFHTSSPQHVHHTRHNHGDTVRTSGAPRHGRQLLRREGPSHPRGTSGDRLHTRRLAPRSMQEVGDRTASRLCVTGMPPTRRTTWLAGLKCAMRPGRSRGRPVGDPRLGSRLRPHERRH